MPILGAHMSIAGGYHRAVERAAAVGCDCVQLFTGNPRSLPVASTHLPFGKFLTRNTSQWRARPIGPDEPARFRAALTQCGIGPTAAHASYLINLASPAEPLWRQSVESLLLELTRAQSLGIPVLVVHPGAHMGAGDEAGLRRIAQALDVAHRRGRRLPVRCLLENTAGQGTSLGWRPEHLATILDLVQEPDRLGVCIDTCHWFAAGYGLAGPQAYRRTIERLKKTIGLAKIEVFHLNDSKREQGARGDRHEHIGRGLVGLDGFRRLLHDERFQRVPMVLETPKGQAAGVDLDVVNLRTLRELAGN